MRRPYDIERRPSVCLRRGGSDMFRLQAPQLACQTVRGCVWGISDCALRVRGRGGHDSAVEKTGTRLQRRIASDRARRMRTCERPLL